MHRSIVWNMFILFVCLALSSAAGTNNVLPSEKQGTPLSASASLPLVITGRATEVAPFSAMLNGIVNPIGVPTTTHFEYGPSQLYGSITAESDPLSGTLNLPVGEVINGLMPNTLYHFRLVATSLAIPTYGADSVFKTPAEQPTITDYFTRYISMSTVTLNGVANPHGDSAIAWFVWGINDSLNHSSPMIRIPIASFDYSYDYFATGLKSNTTYGYQTFVQNSGGVSQTPDRAFFTTLASPFEYLPDESTAGLYHLNEMGAYVQDYSEPFNHGNLSISAPSVVVGKYGFARQFDGVESYIQVNSTTEFQFINLPFTLECWVQPFVNGTDEMVLVSLGNSAELTEAYNFTITPDNNLALSLSGDGTTDFFAFTTSAPIVPGKWQHVAVVVDWDNSVVQFYLNGLLVPSSQTGSLPGTLFVSPAPLRFGLRSSIVVQKQKTMGAPFALDEIRISQKLMRPDDFHLPGTISGIKFWDRNNNQMYDTGDTTLTGWKIVLQQLPLNAGVTVSTPPETVTTDAYGQYAFTGIAYGQYRVTEVQQYGWLQTYPPGDGSYIVNITEATPSNVGDFGNAAGNIYIGPTGGLWSDPGNWSGGTVPGTTTPVFISTSLVYDIASENTIGSLRLAPGATLQFTESAHDLYIEGRTEIDENALLSFPSSGGVGIYCNGDFVNSGTFIPGDSWFYITGYDSKIIFNASSSPLTFQKRGILASSGNRFYNLSISGTNVSTEGNVFVENQLFLDSDLTLRANDTVFVENSSHGAIVNDGLLISGTVRRKISSTNAYRFESPGTFVQFDGTSGIPPYVSMTAIPNTLPETTGIKWKLIPTINDTATNTLKAEGINHFSKWVLGIPGSGVTKRTTVVDSLHVVPQVSRYYVIKPEGETQYNATLQVRYESSEAPTNRSKLTLGQGAYFEDTVFNKWNMVSLPVVPDVAKKDSVFPTAISQAYSFADGYVTQTDLAFGSGYWLKFAQDQVVSILGDDMTSNSIRVEQGWNMIGALSYAVDPATITLIPDAGGSVSLSSTPFFGYRNGYQIADVLKPLRSYWVKVEESGYLLLEKTTATPKLSSSSLFGQVNTLIVRDGNDEERTLYFGYHEKPSLSSYELPPSPPNGTLDVRFTDGTYFEGLGDQHLRTIPIAISSSVMPYRFTWDIRDRSGSGSLLVDGQEIPLHGTGSIVVTNPATQISLRLTSTANTEIPVSFALYQNYPNPFNPVTMIRYSLASAGHVQLKVYNLLGQEVKTLVNGTQDAGYKTVEFDASSLSSGVYFYRLTAGSFTDVKRMMVVR